jgi:acetyl-CoA synthetase
VGRPDDIKGESIVICVVLKEGAAHTQLKAEVIERVERAIGKFARPDEVKVVADLPKTRTGKLLRRLVRAKVSGGELKPQDLSSVENPWCLDGNW